MGSLARQSAFHPWATIGLWAVVITVAIITAVGSLSGALTTDIRFTNDPEAKRALELVEERFGAQGITEIFLIGSRRTTVRSPEFEAHVRDLQQEALAGSPDVSSVVTFYDTRAPSMVSTDKRTTLMPVTFEGTEDPSVYLPHIEELTRSGNTDAFSVRSLGRVTIGEDFTRLAEEGLAKGETFGILAALIVLVFVFGSIVAGILPILIGVAAIAVAIGGVALVGHAFEFSIFVTNMISMMGLAVGIDYSLFIVSRYREERQAGRGKLEAIELTAGTANQAVLVSGATVVVALAGMLIVPHTIYRSLAAGAIFVVVVAVLAASTLLPALLCVLGDKIEAVRMLRRAGRRQPGASRSFWDGATRAVTRRPVMSIAIVATILVVMASFYRDMNTGFAGVTTLPDDAPSRQAFHLLEREFRGGSTSSVDIVVDIEGDYRQLRTSVSRLRDRLAADEDFGVPAVHLSEDRETTILSVPITGDPSGQRAMDAVVRLREEYVPWAFGGDSQRVLVGGQPALDKDFFDLTDDYTPVVFSIVLAMSFVLLTVVFRSIVVPIKAIIMNLLSVGATYGLLVLVFQKGIGAELLGFTRVEAIEAWLPLFLFSMLFGLSMDYHIFLLSRIREGFIDAHDNAGSIAFGLRTTGGLITGAALIMVAVFLGFAAADLAPLQQFGFGLAVAVFLDASLVRCVLVPASMSLLGDRNWYLPHWLRWLPDMSIEPANQRDARFLEGARL